MIVCSCNVLSDSQVRSVVAARECRAPTISQVYAGLGCRARCGGCVATVKKIRAEAACAMAASLSPLAERGRLTALPAAPA
jgi:bacterioferritin-associated ferredoxin